MIKSLLDLVRGRNSSESNAFSEFFYHASGTHKRRVYDQVMDDVIAEKNRVKKKAKSIERSKWRERAA